MSQDFGNDSRGCGRVNRHQSPTMSPPKNNEQDAGESSLNENQRKSRFMRLNDFTKSKNQGQIQKSANNHQENSANQNSESEINESNSVSDSSDQRSSPTTDSSSSSTNWRNRGEFDPNRAVSFNRGFNRGNYRGRGDGFRDGTRGRGNYRGRGTFEPRGGGGIRGRGRGSSRPSFPIASGPFKDPQTPPKAWGIFCLDDYWDCGKCMNKDLQRFTDKLISDGKELGMIFEKPKVMQINLIQDLDDVTLFFEDIFLVHQNLELIFVGIPDKFTQIATDDVYKYIKNYCDNVYGIISSCFKGSFVHNTPDGYFNNFLLKLNAKLGGVNDVYNPAYLDEMSLDPTMLVGVVNNALCLKGFRFSISVANGSYDKYFCKYSSTVRVQRQDPDNMVVSIDSMVRDLLTEYKSHNDGKSPSEIVIFRDGIKRAQFKTLLETEVQSIQTLLEKQQHEIKFCMIVVQKRRIAVPSKPGRRVLFPMEALHDLDVNCDQPDVFNLDDFFIRESSNDSTQFIIVHNNTSLSMEQIKRLSNYATKNYSRSHSKTDIPTCIRYAELCSYRSNLHAQFELDSMSKIPEHEGQSDESKIRHLNSKLQLDRSVKNSLYFC